MDLVTARYNRLQEMCRPAAGSFRPRTEADEDRMAMESMVGELEGPEALERYRRAWASRKAVAPLRFDGTTFDPSEDRERLSRQLDRVRELMSDGEWHSLAYLAEKCRASEPSVSARLRDLRKDRFGGHVIERRREEGGLYLYRMDLEGGDGL